MGGQIKIQNVRTFIVKRVSDIETMRGRIFDHIRELEAKPGSLAEKEKREKQVDAMQLANDALYRAHCALLDAYRELDIKR